MQKKKKINEWKRFPVSFPPWILYDEVQQLSAANHFLPVCRLFQIIYYVQSQPEFRRNLARCDVRRDVWEQKGIPLSCNPSSVA